MPVILTAMLIEGERNRHVVASIKELGVFPAKLKQLGVKNTLRSESPPVLIATSVNFHGLRCLEPDLNSLSRMSVHVSSSYRMDGTVSQNIAILARRLT